MDHSDSSAVKLPADSEFLALMMISRERHWQSIAASGGSTMICSLSGFQNLDHIRWLFHTSIAGIAMSSTWSNLSPFLCWDELLRKETVFGTAACTENKHLQSPNEDISQKVRRPSHHIPCLAKFA
jgi:hypothetical protein